MLPDSLMPSLDRMRRWSCAISIADRNLADCPLVYTNPAFETLTGYSGAENIGRNCRFLQGPKSQDTVVRQMRESIAAGQPFSGCVLNYRKDGTAFDNFLCMSPIGQIGTAELVIGFQYAIGQALPRETLDMHHAMIADVVRMLAELIQVGGELNENLRLFDPSVASDQISGYCASQRTLM